MKIKSDFLLHNTGDEYIVVAVGERTQEFCGMIRLNETGAFLWQQLAEENTKESLVEALLREYEVLEDVAWEAVNKFTKQLLEANLLE